MKYDMKVPCSQCPFRRDREGCAPVRLTRKRVHEIADMMLDRQGGAFPCHKTVDHERPADIDQQIHCAGAMIFAESNGNATQVMRIMERIGFYDPNQFSAETVSQVFATKREMLRTALDSGRGCS